MNDYSYHTVSSIINAYEKSVNFPFKERNVVGSSLVPRSRFLEGHRCPSTLISGGHSQILGDTPNLQSTPADNTHKRVWQYIEKERKKSFKFLPVKLNSYPEISVNFFI